MKITSRKFPLAIIFSAVAVLFCLVFSASAFAELHNTRTPDLSGEFKAGQELHVAFGGWGGAARPPIGQQAFYLVCEEEACENTGALGAEGQILYTGEVNNPGARIPRYISIEGTEFESAGLYVRNQEFAFTEAAGGGDWRSGPWDEIKVTEGPLHLIEGGPLISNVTPPSITGTLESGHEVTIHLGEWAGGEGTKSYPYEVEVQNPADESMGLLTAGETTNVGEEISVEIPAEDVGDHLVAFVTAMDSRGGEWAVSANSTPSEEITSGELTTVEITPSSHDFGEHPEGEVSYQEFTVKNTGSVPLYVGSVTKTGETPNQFSPGSDTCIGHAVAPEETCVYEVAFEPRIDTAPERDGAMTAELQFHDNVAGSPQTVDLSGALEAGPPVVKEFPEITGGSTAGSTVTMSNGVWRSESSVTYSYRWEVCTHEEVESCAPAGDTTNEYKIPNSASGKYLLAWVTAHNAKGETSEDSFFHPVVESGPENSVAPSITGTTEVGHTLSASTGTWYGTEPFEYSYQWERCNASGEFCSSISGATSSTYTLGLEDGGGGYTSRVLVKVKNALNESTAESAHTSVITGGESETAPGAPSTPTLSNNEPIKGTPVSGSEGTGSTGGSPPPTYNYQWQNCTTTSLGSCANISGATSRAYTPVAADVGKYLRVCVTATNSAGSATTCSPESTSPVRAVPGTPSTPTLSPEPPAYGVPIESSAGTGSEGGSPPPTYSYQWQRCTEVAGGCSSISGAIHQAYTPGEADVGKYLRVGVTATNSAGSSATAYSAETTEGVTGVSPTKPEEPVLNSYRPAVGRSINLVHVGGSTGVPAPSYLYQWERCTTKELGSCSDISGATHVHYMPAGADLGKYLRVKIESENSTGTWVDPSEPEFSPPAGPVDSEGSVVCENVSPAPGGSAPTGPATACTEVEEAVSGSALTLSAEAAKTASATTLGPKDQIQHYSIPEVTGDNTGTGNGWNETISQTTFTSGAHTIGSNSGSGELFEQTTGAGKVGKASGNTGAAVTSLTVANNVESTNTSATESEVPVTLPLNIPVPTASHTTTAGDAPSVIFQTADKESGLGNFIFTPTISFDVPADTYSGSYTATTEVDLSTGP